MKRKNPSAAVIRRPAAPVDIIMMADTAVMDAPKVSHHAPGRGMRKLHVMARTNKVSAQNDTKGIGTEWCECILRIRASQDRAAFAALFRHFAPRVKAFLIRSGADAGLAEECTQEVMATVWQKAHLFDPARASAATWIFTIARNRKIDALRRMRRPEPEDLPWGAQGEPDQEETLALQQDSKRLEVALAALPANQKELIEKAYFGDLSHREIAARTGLPLGTIKSRIRLALDRLRYEMK